MQRHLRFALAYGTLLLIIVLSASVPLVSQLNAAAIPATYSVAAVVVACGATAGLLFIYSRLLITPLQHVAAALEAVGQGDLDSPLPEPMPTAFGPIVSGYNAMRTILRERQMALENQLRRTSLLTQISIELGETLDPATIAERVLRVLGSNLSIDQAAILLRLPDSPAWHGLSWSSGMLRPIDGQVVQQMIERGLQGLIQNHGSSTILSDVSRAEHWLAGGGPPQGSAIVLALSHSGASLGSLTVYTQRGGAFTNHDLLLMEGVVAQTGVALSLARRFQAERRLRDQMRQHAEQLEELVSRRTDELQRSRDLLRIVFDNLPEGLLLLDAPGEILATNNAFSRRIVGRSPRDLVGMSYLELWRELAGQSELQLETQGPSERGTPMIPPDGASLSIEAGSWRVISSDIVGQRRWYAVERIPIARQQGRPEQCLERWRDITHQEELQRRLLVHEQLASLGRLAASIAHEVGNPLQSALGCLELCRESSSLDEQAREYLALALGELDRMARIMASLRNLYRPPQIIWEQVDLNTLLRQVAQFTKHQLKQSQVRLTLSLDTKLPAITGQPDGLRQVFLNLVLNAQQAMAQGGEVTISTERRPTDRLCRVVIRDTGSGMSDEQLLHIFEPFRSTKAQGVGLGLYLSRQIIEQHAGHIAVASRPGEGTSVIVQMPWSDAGPWRTPQPIREEQ
jgi:PAS domain S-box-containing protein